MLKANSLLYAVYVCLIVGILCGALLYIASLYEQLNTYYNNREQLYVQNHAAVNYALAAVGQDTTDYTDAGSGMAYHSTTRRYGLLQILVVTAFTGHDSVTSVHLAGTHDTDQTAVYLANFNRNLTFSGDVTLIGDSHVPSGEIGPSFSFGSAGKIITRGKMWVSDRLLPRPDPGLSNLLEHIPAKPAPWSQSEMTGDSTYTNSFQNETLLLRPKSKTLQNVAIKGNFLISRSDTLIVRKNAVLENVILQAPVILIEDGFSGSIQAFSSVQITTGSNVKLNYPSILCVHSKLPAKIEIGDNNRILGGLLLFGNEITDFDQNTLLMGKGGMIVGDVYCAGKFMPQGRILGSVYANEFFYQTPTKTYHNCLVDVTIDVSRRPAFFATLPLFKKNNTPYGLISKVF